MSRKKVRIGIVGVGNCASSFVQGLSHYAEADADRPSPGLMNVEVGGHQVGDIGESDAGFKNMRERERLAGDERAGGELRATVQLTS
jgi:myo-inositol-1-phosphate synthase